MDSENSSDSTSHVRKKTVSTLNCILCGGTQIYPGPRYESHLVNEHGVTSDLEYLIQISIFKKDKGNLPKVINEGQFELLKSVNLDSGKIKKEESPSSSDGNSSVKTTEIGIQTSNFDKDFCSLCFDLSDESNEEEMELVRAIRSEDDDGFMDDSEEEDESSGSESSSNLVSCWLCPACPNSFKRRGSFKSHVFSSHGSDIEEDEVEDIQSTKLTREEFQRRQDPIEKDEVETTGSIYNFHIYNCFFCNRRFKDDKKLRLHLLVSHKSESVLDMEKAKDEIWKAELDGCRHKCGCCGAKFGDARYFFKHVSNNHGLSKSQYKDQYGSSECFTRHFKCEICKKELKHTRNVIVAHLRLMHLMSWNSYKSRCANNFNGLNHLSEDGFKSESKLITCLLCNRDILNLKLHLVKAHNVSLEEYKLKMLSEEKRLTNGVKANDDSFECKICEKSLPYDVSSVNAHLKSVHNLDWSSYWSQCSQEDEDQYQDDEATCKICFIQVKNLKEHLQFEHKKSNDEYDDKKSSSIAPSDYLLVETSLPKPPKSDIQGKQNKTCSSCTITFASRRSFIEHCTTVHNMKFKAKNGLTIQAPIRNSHHQSKKSSTTTHLTPSVTIKRKSDSAPFTLSNLPGGSLLKKPKLDPEALSTSPPSSVSIEPIEKTLGSPYQTTGVSRWNQCKYQCCFCKKTTQSRSSMTSHIANTHGIPIKEYKERNYPDIEVVTNWFQCRLCSTKTKFVKDCISPHLKMSHSIDIEDYERQFMKPEDWPNHQKPVGGTKSELKSETPNNSSRSLLKPSSSPSSTNSDDDNEKKKWNKCRFQCTLCQLITIDARQMRVHISNNHKMSYESYVSQYGSSEILTKKFRCELCNSEMKFCRQNIYAHMKDVHKLTLPEYEARVGFPQEDPESPSDHIVIKNDDDLDENEEEKKLPLANDHFTSKWNKCRYQCQICQRLTSEKPVMRDHILKQHGLPLEEYEMKYGDVEIVTEYFCCAVCQAEVKHCHRNISLHLQKVHNLTTSQYEAEYVNNRLNGIIEESTAELGGFGAHFLLDNDSTSQNRNSNGPPASTPIRPPPREDVLNPKNKYCLACNRDFNRRQAFVEHCRNVHRMKINFARDPVKTEIEDDETPSTTPIVVPKSTPEPSVTASLNCEYCGKQFSNRSNRNRHMLLSCEVVKSGGGAAAAIAGDDDRNEDEMKCSLQGCGAIFLQPEDLNVHLQEEHGIEPDDPTKDEHPGDRSEEAVEVKVEFQTNDDQEEDMQMG